jgi:hypothetical protein
MSFGSKTRHFQGLRDLCQATSVVPDTSQTVLDTRPGTHPFYDLAQGYRPIGPVGNTAFLHGFTSVFGICRQP